MLKKYLSKFTIDILPSVFATVVGAYIVNYYIIPKAREDRPPAAAAAQSAPAPDSKTAVTSPPETSADLSDTQSVPAKKAEKPEPAKPAEAKSADSKPAESRRHVPTRDKAVAKAEPKAEPAAAPVVTPVLATVGVVPASASDDRRDANDLARAAIERLSRSEPKPQEAPRVPERTAAVQPQPAPVQLQPAPPLQQAQPMQQLPPPIVVTSPSVENPQPMQRADNPRRPRPPGEIPVPLAVEANADNGRTNVVDDVLSGARSMFDKVIPKSFER